MGPQPVPDGSKITAPRHSFDIEQTVDMLTDTPDPGFQRYPDALGRRHRRRPIDNLGSIHHDRYRRR
ncbi:MAG: hypothetical protein U5O39_11930 [Gammaproteobacteria bacterium]|nr:hypothetical protein [Gammaproteobacteria bacterium]